MDDSINQSPVPEKDKSVHDGKGSASMKPWQIMLTGILCAAIIGAGVLFGLNWKNWFAPERSATSAQADIDPDARDWSSTINGQKVQNSGEGIAIPGYPSLTFPKDQKNISVNFINPEGNPCYFTFTLILKETGEVLYTSKQVPPGKSISNINLTHALSEGEYPASLQVTTASLADGSQMNGANIETTITVR